MVFYFYTMKKRPNLLYLHGYQGFVTDEKKAFLDQISNAYYPFIDYDLEATTVFEKLSELIDKHDIEIISGTSLGGIMTYYLGIMKNLPTLLLNPAVTAVNQIAPFVPKTVQIALPKNEIVVIAGKEDEVVPFDEQLQFFETLKQNVSASIEIITEDKLMHLVALEDFKRYFEMYFNRLNIDFISSNDLG